MAVPANSATFSGIGPRYSLLPMKDRFVKMQSGGEVTSSTSMQSRLPGSGWGGWGQQTNLNSTSNINYQVPLKGPPQVIKRFEKGGLVSDAEIGRRYLGTVDTQPPPRMEMNPWTRRYEFRKYSAGGQVSDAFGGGAVGNALGSVADWTAGVGNTIASWFS